MASVYLGLGSNIDPARNLPLAIGELRRRYGELRISAVYRNKPVGFDGDDFYNLVVGFESAATPRSICDAIEAIHDLAGRVRGGDKWASRPIDIDLLLYDGLVVDEPPVRVPRRDVLEYSFVLRPLAEIAPDFVHPVTGRTLLGHWQDFDASGHQLDAVELDLDAA